jgi:glycosyltransferase involved in cell wall biosynthesis
MSILYLLTAPPPIMKGTDAVFKEVAALRDAFRGDIVNLFPLKRPSSLFPKPLYGFHNIVDVRQAQSRCKLNHLYFSVPYPFPILRLLRNPIVYTVTASLDPNRKPVGLARLRQLHSIIVSTERDAGTLRSWGLSNYAVIPPGIESSGLVPSSLTLERELTLLMASAPWVRRQFDLKGIDTILESAAQLPFLRLVFLWRGALVSELIERVQRLGIADRVEVINRKVNVGDYLDKAHATVLLAKSGDIVKSCPHSLIESLVAGKPVLLSDTIAMADYVRKHACGVVIENVSVRTLTTAIKTLMGRYVELARNAAKVGPGAFSIHRMVENHRRLYGI